jgi:hypothetical protein
LSIINTYSTDGLHPRPLIYFEISCLPIWPIHSQWAPYGLVWYWSNEKWYISEYGSWPNHSISFWCLSAVQNSEPPEDPPHLHMGVKWPVKLQVFEREEWP